MKKLKIILMGIGSVGKGITKVLVKTNGIQIVGAIDSDPEKVGKDLGMVAGLERILNINISDNAEDLLKKIEADILIHTTIARELEDVYEEIKTPISEGMNVISACLQVSDPYFYNPLIAAMIEKRSKKYGVTVLGTGSVQSSDRLILFLTEQCHRVNQITFLAHRDVSQFSAESNSIAIGIGLNHETYIKRRDAGEFPEMMTLKGEVSGIAERLGWPLDDNTLTMEPILNDNNIVRGAEIVCCGKIKNEYKIQMKNVFILDPNHEYSYSITIEGTPRLESQFNFSPERSLQGTISPIVNAITRVINAEPGILSPFDMKLAFPSQADFRILI